MTITDRTAVRERTRREAIDEMLLRLCSLARENDKAMLRLRTILLNAPPEAQTPERPARPGWFGEIADALELTIGHLEDTAKVLEEVEMQVTKQTPTVAAPRR